MSVLNRFLFALYDAVANANMKAMEKETQLN